ncbi:MAG TPA: DUF58 domain-containing protein [Dehalococcoidia bacterium]|jgi:uncharacterized protein (DUF58 family)|nr:DUF58 domain-containing protein [Dehalococcoidia bacterium]
MTTDAYSTDLNSSLSQEEMLARVRRLQIRARRLVRLLFLGEYHSVFRGRGLEFSEVREYEPGDEVRMIDWNVTARMGAPYIKKYVEERELVLYLLVDVSPSSSFSSTANTKRELAAELALLLAFAANANNDKTGLIAFSDRIELFVPPRKGLQHVLRLARELLYLEPKGRGTNIGIATDLLMSITKRPSVAFVISDFLASGFESSLRLAAQKHDLTAISITDPRELELPRVGIIRLEDPETGAQVLVDTEDARERTRYATAAAERVVGRRRLLAGLGVEEVPLRTDRSYIQPLMTYFKARAGRRRTSV